MYPDIYDVLAEGGSVHDAIADMTVDEMEEFFSDADPCAFL